MEYHLEDTDFKTIQKAGFDVYVCKQPTTYAHYTDGIKIGYIQNNYWGYSLSTVPRKGNSFRVPPSNPNHYYWVHALITPALLKSAFILAPHWASHSDLDRIGKYRDFEAFRKAHWQPLYKIEKVK